MSEIYTNIGDECPVEVYYQDEINLDIDGQMMYIRSGQEEIKTYVETVSKPDIDTYTESICTSFINQAKAQAEIATAQADIASAKALQSTQSASTASDNATLAASLATQAAQSAANAASSASTATDKANEAATSASEAASSVSSAASSASTASESATTATNAKTAAETAQSNAAASAETARKQAVGTLAENSAGSAKYWAEQAMATTESTVNLADMQTITGYKTFTKTIYGTSGFDLTTNPSADKYFQMINAKDNNDMAVGYVEVYQATNGNSAIDLVARREANGVVKYNVLRVGMDTNGTAYTSCATPPSAANGTEIATTGWVRNYVALDYNTVVSVSGTGTKTTPYDGVLIITPTSTGGQEFSECKISIGGNQYVCAQGFYGSDYAHVSQVFFPFKSGATYSIDEIIGCQLRYVKRGI